MPVAQESQESFLHHANLFLKWVTYAINAMLWWGIFGFLGEVGYSTRGFAAGMFAGPPQSNDSQTSRRGRVA